LLNPTNISSNPFSENDGIPILKKEFSSIRIGPIIIMVKSSGWWCNNHLEKYEFVSWDGLFPIYGKMFQTTNQINMVKSW
jgi:hypothetical protein